MIKVGCHSLTWANFYRGKTYDLKEVLRDIKKIGYDGAELVEPLSAIGDITSFKELLHSLELELVSLSCSPDKYIRSRIDFLKDFDTNIVMLCAGWIKKGWRKEGVLIHSLRNDLNEIAQYADEQDLNLAFHPHKDTLIETKEDLEEFYSEPTPVKLCLDIAHIAACGSDPLEILKEFRNKINYIHIKDYDYENREFVELGQGDLNLKEIISYLKKNYTGWITVEVDETRSNPNESAAISRAYLKNLGL